MNKNFNFFLQWLLASLCIFFLFACQSTFDKASDSQDASQLNSAPVSQVVKRSESLFIKANDSILCDNHILPDIDYNSFEVIAYYYAKDKDSVYYKCKKLNEADPDSFELIKSYYTKDKNFVYYDGKKLLKADPKDFSLTNHLNQDLSYSNNYTYYKDKLISSKNTSSILLNVEWFSEPISELDFNPLSIFTPDKNDSYMQKVGKVVDEPYVNWHVMRLYSRFGGYGGQADKFYIHFVVNPSNSNDYKIISYNSDLEFALWRDFGSYTNFDELIDLWFNHVDIRHKLYDLNYPESISLFINGGELNFIKPSKYLDIDWFPPKLPLYHDEKWGDIYEYTTKNIMGAIALKTDPNIYILYLADYKNSIPFNAVGGIDIKWEDLSYGEFRPMFAFHCESGVEPFLIPESVIDVGQLDKVGHINSDPIYSFSLNEGSVYDYLKDNLFGLIDRHQNFNKNKDGSIKDPNYKEKSAVLWQDPIGRWVMFFNSKMYGC